ncbi:MAG: glycosyltransferase [Chlamydiales bacterium]|nr:glycosyltransferase [Chlamydiales bacterium]
MIERIDILLPPANRCGYGVLPYFSRSFLAALERLGISCRLLGNEDGPTPNLVGDLLRDTPDCTLSFNGLLPDENNNFFCERVQIPHVACLVDSPNKFLSMVQSPLNIITCIDQDWANFFTGLHHHNTFFMPHAVESGFSGDLEGKRPYDVSFLGTCLDIDELRSTWPDLFGPAVTAVLDAATEIALADQTTSYLSAFTQAMDERLRTHGDIDPSTLDLCDVLDNLEFYIRGKDRLELLLSLKDIKVHVFGTKSGSHGWEKYLKSTKNLEFHGRVPYAEALDVLTKSRLVINSCPSIKAGAHERIFAGFMAGAAVLSNDNSYIRTLFDADGEILLYRHDGYRDAGDQIAALLKDEDRRRSMVASARQKVETQHTWDQRAKVLLEHLERVLPPILQQL